MKKKLNRQEVTSCDECPFRNYSYDDFALGDAESYHCILIQRDWVTTIINNKVVPFSNYFIHFYKNGKVKSKNRKTLDNCPLLEQDIIVTLNK